MSQKSMSQNSPAEKSERQKAIGVICLLLAAIVTSVALIDVPVSLLFQSTPQWLHVVMRNCSRIGDSSWSIPLSLLLVAVFGFRARITEGATQSLARRRRNASLFVLTNVAVSGLVTVALKGIIGRARPGVAGPGESLSFHPFIHSSDWASFPSGHTTTGVALALSLAMLFPRARPVLVAVAALVGLSRVVLDVHWVSDTFAGALVAFVTLQLLVPIFRQLCASGYRLQGAPRGQIVSA
ncbi:phosphatase PAP2 family protein [Paracoccus aminophilus]|nr:phosphatase PAP2 family protein [Paracoccus aminophilus]